MELTSFLLIFVTILGWGVWGFLQKIGVEKVGPQNAVFLNGVAMVAIGAGYLILSEQGITVSWSAVYSFSAGIAAATGTAAFFTALQKMQVSVARPLVSLCILVTALLGVLFLGEQLKPIQWLGIGLAVMAMILLSQ